MSDSEANIRELFLKKLLDSNEGKEDHYNVITKDKYDSLIAEVEAAIAAAKKSTMQKRRVERFNVLRFNECKMLVTRSEPVKYFLPIEDVFDIVEAAHIAIGHGGRDRLKAETSRKYANVTTEMINVFLAMCETCRKRKKFGKKGLVSEPMLHSQFNSRCQVDLIDMQSRDDGDFKFIMNYQDHLTKFVVLRPLKTMRADEVASEILDIFLTFGAPSIMHSNNGAEFVNQIIFELRALWPELRIVRGKPRHPQSRRSVERASQDVEKMLAAWMTDNSTSKWSDGLKFVQFMKNRAHHSGIKMTPYKAMFGTDPRVGLTTTNLPNDAIDHIQDEHDLEKCLNQMQWDDSGN